MLKINIKLILVVVLSLVIFSCTVRETPEFVTIKNIKVLESNNNFLTLKGDALFRNSNDIGGKLQADGIKVYVNGNEMATVSSESFDVPAKEEFTIPLKVNIPTDSIISSKNIGGLIGSLLTQKMEVQYVGKINYKVLGFSHSYTVDETETVRIRL